MTLIEMISEAVTAKQAGELYGLKFNKKGKAVCPWHNDHSPSLSFKGNRCKCFACNNGGDAVDLTAQILGIPLMEAAKRIQADFGINCEVDNANLSQIRAKQRAKELEKRAQEKHYDYLCKVERNNWAALQAFDPETAWDNPKFVSLLKAFSRAQDELNAMTT